MTPLVSIIAPVLDEAVALPGLLDRLAGRWEIVICDGAPPARLARLCPHVR